MQLNKAVQYAILLVLYLFRSGRAPLKAVAAGLSLSLSFLREVALKLVDGRVLKGIKGPGGGYEVNGDPSMRDVLECFSPITVMAESQLRRYQAGQAEYRALAKYVTETQAALSPLLRCKVRTLNATLVAGEMARLNRSLHSTAVN